MTNYSSSQTSNRVFAAVIALVLTAASIVIPGYATNVQAAAQPPAPVSYPLA
jgi:hypothetical protein